MSLDKSTFCIAPFKHACLDSKGYLKVCCVSGEKLQYKFDKIEDWYHSEEVSSLRNNLKNGIKDPRCSNCWIAQSNDKGSQRMFYNKNILDITDHYIAKNGDKLEKMFAEPSVDIIDSFDLKLGNLCNLKCIMCKSSSSSQLLAEVKMNPQLGKYYGEENIKDYVWAEQQTFRSWCEEYLPKSTNIKFTGGEPLINPYLLDVLDFINPDQKKLCTLHFTTNATEINQRLLDKLDEFKKVKISVSVEGTGGLLEYVRYPHKWNNLKENILLLKSYTKQNIELRIQHVIQSTTLFGIIDLVRFFDQHELPINPLILTTPKHFHINSLKTEHKEKFLTAIKNYVGFNNKFINSVKQFVSNNMDYDKTLAVACVQHLSTLDAVRNNNFRDVISLDYFL